MRTLCTLHTFLHVLAKHDGECGGCEQERLAEEAEEPAAGAEPGAVTEAAPPTAEAEADPFGLEQIIQKAEAPRCAHASPACCQLWGLLACPCMGEDFS